MDKLTVSELPWWVAGLVLPLAVGATLAVITGLCLVLRTAALTIIAGVQSGQQAFLDDMKAERERNREERGLERKDRSEERAQFMGALNSLREEFQEHTQISKQMYHRMERIEDGVERLHRGLGVAEEMEERAQI